MTRNSDAALVFSGITVRYRGSVSDALSGVTIAVHPGAVTAVVGPNGSGKSTLVRALLRLVPLAAGDIVVGGRRLHGMSQRELARLVAVVPQREEPSAPLVVRELVSLGRYAHRGLFSATDTRDNEIVEEALRKAGALDLIDRRSDTLSGGEWQRIRIARALAQECPVLVLDEPTTFLDIRHEMAIFELMDRFASTGGAVLLISHQLNLVARYASQISLLDEGRIAATGTPDEVMRGDVLESVYDWPLVVTRDPAIGAPALLPLRSGGRARVIQGNSEPGNERGAP